MEGNNLYGRVREINFGEARFAPATSRSEGKRCPSTLAVQCLSYIARGKKREEKAEGVQREICRHEYSCELGGIVWYRRVLMASNSRVLVEMFNDFEYSTLGEQ